MELKEDVIKRRLEAFGIQPNKYRREILAYLESARTHYHPTAAEVLDHLKQKFPYVSQATVYNTLNLFLAKGLVLALQPEGNTVRYDATTGDHCHFVCENCGVMIDIPEKVLIGGKERRRIRNNTINRMVTYLFGICEQCQEAHQAEAL